MDVILIAAITQDGFIARHEHETVTWSKDLHLFKSQTMGYPVIMGSNTFNCIQQELKGREVLVVHRKDNPKDVLEGLQSEKCFIAGGGKTNARFAEHLTHIYLTPHPLVFGDGIRLFSDPVKEMELVFKKRVPVLPDQGIDQYQYKIK